MTFADMELDLPRLRDGLSYVPCDILTFRGQKVEETIRGKGAGKKTMRGGGCILEANWKKLFKKFNVFECC